MSQSSGLGRHHPFPVPRILPGILLHLALGPLGWSASVYAQEQNAVPTPVTSLSPSSAKSKAADDTKKSEPGKPGATADDAAVQTVSVVAQRQSEQIDRSVYEVKPEYVTPNASAADVIANVPNVSVDQNGKVAIRGNQNTRVYVDGKPSAMFAGANGGEALNIFPADGIQRIEVITTPGAEFGSEGGSGPILNLVTSRVRRPGGLGNLTAGAGMHGQKNASLNGSFNAGPYQFEGQGGITRRSFSQAGWTNASYPTASGATWTTRRDATGISPTDAVNLNAKATYNFEDADRATVGMNFMRTKSLSERMENYVSYHGAQTPYESYGQERRIATRMSTYMLAVSYEHKLESDGKLNYDLRTSANLKDQSNFNHNSYLVTPPSGPRTESLNTQGTSSRLTDFSIDYSRKFTPQINVRAGVKTGINRGTSDRDYFSIDPLTGEETVVNDRSTAFRSTEHSYAAYLSPNFQLSENWAVLPGVRLESLTGKIDYIGQANSAIDSSRKLLPSLHAQYAWGKANSSSVTAAYSRRFNRPRLDDLNPNIQYVSDQSYTQGDPRLKPTHIDHYDLKYVDQWDWLNTNFSLFREEDAPLLGHILTAVPNTGAFLNQAVNFGARITNGASLDFQGRPVRSFDLGATFGFRRVAQSYLSTVFNTDRTTSALETIRRNDSKDVKLRAAYYGLIHTFSLNANYTGATLFGLIKTDPTWQATASWSWKIDTRLSLRSSVVDIFNSNIRRSIQDTPAYKLSSYNRIQGRALTVALTYRLGGVTGDPRLRSGIVTPRPSVIQPKPAQ